MSDRIDPSTWPTPRGPWPPVTDLHQLYDHGVPWCVNRAAHPDENDGYPAAQQHVPWDECQTVPYFLDGTVRDLNGEDLGLLVYGATRFRFGETRSDSVPSAARLVLETWSESDSQPAARVSLSLGEALRLARIVQHLVDLITFHPGDAGSNG